MFNKGGMAVEMFFWGANSIEGKGFMVFSRKFFVADSKEIAVSLWYRMR
jgi:hypothetical protein